MMKRVADFPMSVQDAANTYVSMYLRDNGIRGVHLQLMKMMDESDTMRQLSECIDILLFENMLVESAEYEYENANWHDDAHHW
jgi:hypothetical protein